MACELDYIVRKFMGKENRQTGSLVEFPIAYGLWKTVEYTWSNVPSSHVSPTVLFCEWNYSHSFE